MKTRNLDEGAFKSTMTPKMRDVTESASGADVDMFAYVEAVPAAELRGHEIYDQFVEYVSERKTTASITSR